MNGGDWYRLVEMSSTQWTMPETNVFVCFIITGVLRRLILCFSFYSNTKSLISTEGPPGMISCLNGMRFFSITWVISGHSVLFYLLTVIGKLSSLHPEHELSSLRHGPIISLTLMWVVLSATWNLYNWRLANSPLWSQKNLSSEWTENRLREAYLLL